jgi:hypothetical protein
MFDADPNKSTEQLLEQIRNGAILAVNQRIPDAGLPAMAALLVRLSREASETADKNLTIQKNLIKLTYVILGLTVVMLILQAVALVKG